MFPLSTIHAHMFSSKLCKLLNFAELASNFCTYLFLFSAILSALAYLPTGFAVYAG